MINLRLHEGLQLSLTPLSAVQDVALYVNLLERAHVAIRQTHPRSSKEPQREHDALAVCWLAAYPTTC